MTRKYDMIRGSPSQVYEGVILMKKRLLARGLLGLSTAGSQAQRQQRNEGGGQKTLLHEDYSFVHL